MKKIPLTKGKFAIVDDDDYEWLSQWKWYAAKGHNTYYAKRHTTKQGSYTTIEMHTLICDAEQIDHKDGNGLNNQRNNLRPATYSQNAANRTKQINNTSGFKGVYWHKHASKWYARIQVNNKRINLGYFTNKIEAAKSYDKAASIYFGEFAKLNF